MKKLLLLLLFIFPHMAQAHVKWFSDYNFIHTPLEFAQLFSPTFWGLFALSLISLPLLVYTDKLGEKSLVYQRINGFFDRYSDNSTLVMRIAMAAVLVMSWQGDSMIAPEIPATATWGWLQLLFALLLLFKETSVITGAGMLIIYVMGIYNHGFFHMLDYVVYPAVGLFLIVTQSKNSKIKNLDLPILYSGLGFSLCWVSFEKLIYPFWGLEVLSQAPQLTMGLNHEFFLMACAFIEFTLGYLLIICLLHRPLAAIITLVFFTTTMFFGKTEVVGHTILHGALIVFILKGPGHHYLTPIRLHKSLWLRSAFAIVNFVVLFVIMAIPYQNMSKVKFNEALANKAAMAHPKFEITDTSNAPSVMIHPMKDDNGGYNIHFMAHNFKFTPQNAGKEDVVGEGHGHLYLNGKKIGRVYSEWIHLALPKGKNKLKITLNTNTHKDYAVGGNVIKAEIEIDESRDVPTQHVH